MESLHLWISTIIIYILLFIGQSTATDTDGKAGEVGDGLGVVPDLVFKIQQILIKYDCKYKDPDGVCSTGTAPHCNDVKESGVCVLNSCPGLSESDRDALAELLVKIGVASHEVCGWTKEDLLKAANGQPKSHVSVSGLLLTTVLSLLLIAMPRIDLVV